MPKKFDKCLEKVKDSRYQRVSTILKNEYGFNTNPYAVHAIGRHNISLPIVNTKSMSSEILFPKEQEMYSRLRFKEHYSKEKALRKINEYRASIGRVMLDLSKFI